MDRAAVTVPQFLAAEPQYVHHLGPVWAALGADGACWYVTEAARPAWAAHGAEAARWQRTAPGPLVVASAQDHSRARRAGSRVVFLEHGCGQTYGGDPRMARHPSYAGGNGRDGAGLILAPNEMAADRWRSRYPGVPVHVIGATRVLNPPEDPRARLLVVAFHWNGAMPELRSAWPHYAPHLARLGLPLALHAHPRAASALSRWAERAGVEFIPDLADVARRATVFAVDNSSTLWEMAVHRPVIALNAPWYRRNVHHGLRFWSHVPGPQVDDAAGLAREAARLLDLGELPEERERRALVVRSVIPHLDGAERAARLIAEWTAEGA